MNALVGIVALAAAVGLYALLVVQAWRARVVTVCPICRRPTAHIWAGAEHCPQHGFVEPVWVVDR